jgi:hypothetical protein
VFACLFVYLLVLFVSLFVCLLELKDGRSDFFDFFLNNDTIVALHVE